MEAIEGLRNVQISYGEMMDLYLLFHDLTQSVPFFFLEQKIMIQNQNPFPFNALGFETHCSNSLVLYSYSSFA
jgi:hypothetical protein